MAITWKQLKGAREHADLTQGELAEALGVSQRTIVNWEREGASVPRKSEYKVQRVLGAALDAVEFFESSRHAPLNEIPPEPVYIVPGPDGEGVHTTKADFESYIRSVEKSALAQDYQPQQIARRRAALSPFTEMDLLTELIDRASSRGGRLSDWSATGHLVNAPASTNVTPLRQTENLTAEEEFDPESLPHAAYADTEEPGDVEFP